MLRYFDRMARVIELAADLLQLEHAQYLIGNQIINNCIDIVTSWNFYDIFMCACSLSVCVVCITLRNIKFAS